MRNLLGKPPEHIRGSSAVYRRDRMMEQSDFASANVAGSVRRSDETCRLVWDLEYVGEGGEPPSHLTSVLSAPVSSLIVYSLPGCRPTGAGANTESRQVTVPIQSVSESLVRDLYKYTISEAPGGSDYGGRLPPHTPLHRPTSLHGTRHRQTKKRSQPQTRQSCHVVQHPLTPGRAAAQTTTVLKPQQTALSEPNRLSSAVVSPNPTSAVRESVIRSLFTCQKCAFASTKPAPLGENTRATIRARRHSSTVSARALALSTAGRLAACSTASSLSLSM